MAANDRELDEERDRSVWSQVLAATGTVFTVVSFPFNTLAILTREWMEAENFACASATT